ncbi:hypothetical protein Tco_1560550, partial [Tanacetum coccineum]
MTAYTRRFQELVLLCARMVLDEEEKVERFIGGLPDNIQGNGCARSAENKIRFDNNPRDNRGHQSAIKQQNVGGQNVARAYMAGNNEKKWSGYYRKDCPKLRNQNRGNKTGNNEATTKAYAIRRGGANPDSNVVTGMFLLNNCYASMLFDSGADRSFVSSTLAKYHAVIICDEKIVRIPYGDEMLIIR